MREIPSTQGKVALVDLEDYYWLIQWKWQAQYNPVNNSWKAARKDGRSRVYTHRQIMNSQADMDVDHINRDGLDNRRSNLRICTHQQNTFNRGSKQGLSKYKGVSWHKWNKKWQVKISVNGKEIPLGYSDNEEEAAKMYDRGARKYHGEYAGLNFPGEQ